MWAKLPGSAVPECERPPGGQGTGEHAGAGTGDAEACALLIDEVGDADRAGRRKTFGLERGDSCQERGAADGTVEHPVVWNRIQMGAGDDAGRPAVAAASGSPHQAH